MAALEGRWEEALRPEFNKEYYRKLYAFVKEEYSTHVIYPPSDRIFTALQHTQLEDVKVVIMGQDPYHEPGQAMGMSFSVPEGIAIPPSLRNIYKEIHEDVGERIPQSGDLTRWADQGVLLLNAVLTVRQNQADSHKGKGWEEFTDAIIRAVEKEDRPVVYMLWGRHAREKKVLVNNPKHMVLEAAHPSPLSASRGFFNCKHFSKCNRYLEDHGVEPINWG